VFDEVIGYSVAMVSRVSAKLHLKLALSDSGNRDWDANHVGGAFPAFLGLKASSCPMNQ
jgi:hypothetical protein